MKKFIGILAVCIALCLCMTVVSFAATADIVHQSVEGTAVIDGVKDDAYANALALPSFRRANPTAAEKSSTLPRVPHTSSTTQSGFTFTLKFTILLSTIPALTTTSRTLLRPSGWLTTLRPRFVTTTMAL